MFAKIHVGFFVVMLASSNLGLPTVSPDTSRILETWYSVIYYLFIITTFNVSRI